MRKILGTPVDLVINLYTMAFKVGEGPEGERGALPKANLSYKIATATPSLETCLLLYRVSGGLSRVKRGKLITLSGKLFDMLPDRLHMCLDKFCFLLFRFGTNKCFICF